MWVQSLGSARYPLKAHWTSSLTLSVLISLWIKQGRKSLAGGCPGAERLRGHACWPTACLKPAASATATSVPITLMGSSGTMDGTYMPGAYSPIVPYPITPGCASAWQTQPLHSGLNLPESCRPHLFTPRREGTVS